MRVVALIITAVVVSSGSALAGTRTKRPVATESAAPVTGAVEEPEARKWEFSATAFTYFLPDSRDYIQPTITADRGWLHLEARYNYEALEAGSAWIGCNFSGGKKLAWTFTPMIGGVFGDLKGIAPGYKGSLTWGKLEFYSEGEYVFDSQGSEGSFFYNWSELTLAPVDWFQFGLVTQRTRAYASPRDIQRGALVRFTHKNVNLTGYVLNLDLSQPTYIFAFGIGF